MRNVCGIGFFPAEVTIQNASERFKPGKPLPLTIVGTGFLIQPQTVLTVGHVYDALIEPACNGAVDVPVERIVFVFVDYLENGDIAITLSAGI